MHCSTYACDPGFARSDATALTTQRSAVQAQLAQLLASVRVKHLEEVYQVIFDREQSRVRRRSVCGSVMCDDLFALHCAGQNGTPSRRHKRQCGPTKATDSREGKSRCKRRQFLFEYFSSGMRFFMFIRAAKLGVSVVRVARVVMHSLVGF